MSDDIQKVLDQIKENDVEFVDLRFTDPRGKWQHTAQHVSTINEDVFAEGFQFDGSSIAGWKAINESDMLLVPDPTTAVMDPFTAQPSMIMFCDIVEPSTGEAYARDPRSAAKRAEAYLNAAGIGDTAYFGPEAEFFVFDDVRFDVSMNQSFYEIDSTEGPYNSGNDYPEGNFGHRPGIKGGYFPVPPVDSMSDLRAEMVSTLVAMGVEMEKHHHEVAPSQNELGNTVHLADPLRRQHAALQVRRAHGRGELWQDGNLHAQAGARRQRLGHAHAPVVMEGPASRCSPARATPICQIPRSTISAA